MPGECVPRCACVCVRVCVGVCRHMLPGVLMHVWHDFADFDQDGFIGHADLMSCLTTMTKNELSPEEHQQIADKVIEEADVDGDGKLSILEFEHVILRAPDFLSTFHIRI